MMQRYPLAIVNILTSIQVRFYVSCVDTYLLFCKKSIWLDVTGNSILPSGVPSPQMTSRSRYRPANLSAVEDTFQQWRIPSLEES
jgi:hypothetical protein